MKYCEGHFLQTYFKKAVKLKLLFVHKLTAINAPAAESESYISKQILFRTAKIHACVPVIIFNNNS